MTNIVVVFPQAADGKNIKNILVRNGFTVAAVATSGAEALNIVAHLNDGVIISGVRCKDMVFADLFVQLPQRFGMVLLAAPIHWNGWERRDQRILCLPMPIKVHELVEGCRQMCRLLRRAKEQSRQKPRVRSQEEIIKMEQCKAALMREWGMEEPEAHRYIQNFSMSRRISLMEAADRLLQERNATERR